MVFIKVRSVSKNFGNLEILKDVTFSVNKGEFVSIIGPYGCGKTTLLKLLAGILENYSGQISIQGENPLKKRQSRKIGYSPQKLSLLPWRNVLENLLLPQDISGFRNPKRAYELLDLIGSKSLASKKVYELSGGMQQIVSVIRSLMLDPDILLLDEPFSSIDAINQAKVHQKILQIHRQTKKTTILVTHSIEEAVFLSDRVIVMTNVPSSIKRIFEFRLKSRNESFRYSTMFLDYIKNLRSELINE